MIVAPLTNFAPPLHSQIAALRGTAVRTVSNQIATLCRKLAQHGRFELVRYWASLQWGNSAGAV